MLLENGSTCVEISTYWNNNYEDKMRRSYLKKYHLLVADLFEEVP